MCDVSLFLYPKASCTEEVVKRGARSFIWFACTEEVVKRAARSFIWFVAHLMNFSLVWILA